MSREVPLTKGFVALVDDEDYERVMAVGRWHARDRKGKAYALHTFYLGHRRRKNVSLHTFLTGWPLVDHRNGNGLDNRRSNLRQATQRDNCRNVLVRPGSTSPFKGVSAHRDTGRWRSRIFIAGREIALGVYVTEEQAAQAYDAAARKHFGEFATLNFPEPHERSAVA